jgi:hypothetical protein
VYMGERTSNICTSRVEMPRFLIRCSHYVIAGATCACMHRTDHIKMLTSGTKPLEKGNSQDKEIPTFRARARPIRHAMQCQFGPNNDLEYTALAYHSADTTPHNISGINLSVLQRAGAKRAKQSGTPFRPRLSDCRKV